MFSQTNQPIVTSCPREEVFCWRELPLVRCRLDLPHFPNGGRGMKRMERYYRRLEGALVRRLSRELGRYTALAEQALARSRPLPFFWGETGFQVTYESRQLLSILWYARLDRSELRRADLWSLPEGLPENPASLLPPGRAGRRRDKLLVRGEGIYALRGLDEELLAPLPKELLT